MKIQGEVPDLPRRGVHDEDLLRILFGVDDVAAVRQPLGVDAALREALVVAALEAVDRDAARRTADVLQVPRKERAVGGPVGWHEALVCIRQERDVLRRTIAPRP